jgi:hypothetical protein
MSRSEVLCYSAMIINHLALGALLSMPLPLSIFLCGMLLTPQASRNYWERIFTYTLLMIIFKYLFQIIFHVENAYEVDDDLLSVINLIGFSVKEDAVSIVDLVLLLSLFLHRSILTVSILSLGNFEFEFFFLAIWTLESRTRTIPWYVYLLR